MAYAPLVGQDGGSRKSDLPDGPTDIFLSERLDRLLVICPSCQFVAGIIGCVVGQIRRSRSASVQAGRPASAQLVSRAGTPTAAVRGTDADDVQWVPVDELERYRVTTTAIAVIRKACA